MMTNFNWVDYIAIAIFLFSTLVGLTRGLLRELFALITWIVAFVVGIMYAPILANYFLTSSFAQNMLSSASDSMGMKSSSAITMLAVGICFVIIFIVILILGRIIGYLFSFAATGSGMGFTNRLLGGVFGFARGVLIVIFAIFVLQMTPVNEQSWWSQSLFVNYFQPSVKWLNDAIQPGITSLKTKMGDTLQNVNQSIQNTVNSVTGH